MNEWLAKMGEMPEVAYTIFAIGLAAVAGLALGELRWGGVGLGVSGVLFSSLLLGHAGMAPEANLLELARDFGLVLFVYSIGIKVGPGFFRSLKRSGLALNGLALAIVLMGGGLTVGIALWLKVDVAAAAGVFSGATTNTPSLGAAQETLRSLGASPERVILPTLGYAVTYPFGIAGILLAMMLVRGICRVDMKREAEALHREEEKYPDHVERRSLLANRGLAGEIVEVIAERYGVTISRVLRRNERHPRLARLEMVVREGDALLAIGTAECLNAFEAGAGLTRTTDLMELPCPIVWKNIIVTRDDLVGKSLGSLGLDRSYEVTATRVVRGDEELPARENLRLQLGDRIRVVGGEAELAAVGKRLGNSRDALDHFGLMPLLVGICAGILIGNIPVPMPGVPTPIRIGLAGGPLVAALLLGRIGSIGRMSWHMAPAANAALRDLGITIFLAAVGLKAGGRFVETLLKGDGVLWLGMGAAVTLVPLLLAGVAGMIFLRINFLRMCGVLSGSMTDPPALAFATTMTKSDTVAVSYAAVYPMAMIARIVLVQVIILIFGGSH